jgi:hypothetical protein
MKQSKFLQRLVRLSCGLALTAAAAQLTGCAENASDYPSVGTINDMSKKTLSPQEQDKALNDLTREKEKQGQAAKSSAH